MRQIMGVFSQLEKTRLVKKFKAARDRKRVHGKVEGRKTRLERIKDQPLRKISAELAAAGFVNERGKPYHSQSIRRMIDGARPTDG